MRDDLKLMLQQGCRLAIKHMAIRIYHRCHIEESDDGTYLLNSKDLNMLAHLDDLAAAGVSSVKIEGRVKKAFYVATVVNAYRHVLDGEPASLWEHELEIISHRPYSTGFFGTHPSAPLSYQLANAPSKHPYQSISSSSLDLYDEHAECLVVPA